MDNAIIQPFLKWPGGKRWLIEWLIDDVSIKSGKYIEPFLGGGAFFFALQPECAIISDINKELIELYKVMRDCPDALREKMIYHQKHHDAKYYYKMRAMHPRTPINRAARMLYLNRTCFNGMYRVNKKGDFNVPIGSKTNCIYDIDLFCQYADILKKAEIVQSDFADTIMRAETGDCLFADPPYAVGDNNLFVKYNNVLFSWNDQMRLFEALKTARNKGVNVISTNAFCGVIKEMYLNEHFYVYEVERHCSIAGNPNKRKITKELVVSTSEIKRMRNKNDTYSSIQ